jgi:hypothetical protein
MENNNILELLTNQKNRSNLHVQTPKQPHGKIVYRSSADLVMPNIDCQQNYDFNDFCFCPPKAGKEEE